MKNVNLKDQFIKSYATSASSIALYSNIFQIIGRYEDNTDCDVFAMSVQQLNDMINEFNVTRHKSSLVRISMLRSYVKWCKARGVNGVTDNIFEIDVDNCSRVREVMVANPKQLQFFLDKMYDPESDETIDNIFRCYFWLAFSGMEAGDIVLLEDKHIVLEDMCVRYNMREYPIYREAIPCIKNCLNLKSFLYKHPHYEPVRRDRLPGNMIMRGIKSIPEEGYMRNTTSRDISRAYKAGRIPQKLSHGKAFLSGMFYRIYELEKAGVPTDFSEVAIMMGTKSERLDNAARNVRDDYYRWKIAFML